ncbi:MAG: hypothetical protein QM767_16675 [Anaeromyxobacter sp.]
MSALPIPLLHPTDLARLEARAQELAAPAVAGEDRVTQRLVAFGLGGRPCAVEADAVLRAVSRLGPPLAVPLAAGGERWVVFVDERPVPLVDAGATVGPGAAGSGGLEGRPALLVEAEGGPVAVAVEAPLELLEERLAAAAAPVETGAVRLAGVLEGGTSVLDAGWLRSWAGKAARP